MGRIKMEIKPKKTKNNIWNWDEKDQKKLGKQLGKTAVLGGGIILLAEGVDTLAGG